jgi:hypothetical protein
MKSGITFALLLGVFVSITGLLLKTMNWTDPIRLTIANGLTLMGIFIAVFTMVLWILKNARRSHE